MVRRFHREAHPLGERDRLPHGSQPGLLPRPRSGTPVLARHGVDHVEAPIPVGTIDLPAVALRVAPQSSRATAYVCTVSNASR